VYFLGISLFLKKISYFIVLRSRAQFIVSWGYMEEIFLKNETQQASSYVTQSTNQIKQLLVLVEFNNRIITL